MKTQRQHASPARIATRAATAVYMGNGLSSGSADGRVAIITGGGSGIGLAVRVLSRTSATAK